MRGPRLAMVACVMASFALVACGGPPEEATSLDRAAADADISVTCSNPPPPPPSLPTQSPTANGLACIPLNRVARAFNTSSFEQGLLSLGCNLSLVPGNPPGPVNSMPVANYPQAGLNTTYNLTACRRSCSLDTFLAANAATWFHSTIDRATGRILPGFWRGNRNPDGSIVDAHESTAAPYDCYTTTPPAGVVYVEWDPKCTGGCVGYTQ